MREPLYLQLNHQLRAGNRIRPVGGWHTPSVHSADDTGVLREPHDGGNGV